MSNQNSELTNTWQPDPAWDYYTLWHDLIHIKAKVDQALNVMKHFEEATTECDENIREIIEPASDSLIAIIENELALDDDE